MFPIVRRRAAVGYRYIENEYMYLKRIPGPTPPYLHNQRRFRCYSLYLFHRFLCFCISYLGRWLAKLPTLILTIRVWNVRQKTHLQESGFSSIFALSRWEVIKTSINWAGTNKSHEPRFLWSTQVSSVYILLFFIMYFIKLTVMKLLVKFTST